MSREAIRYAVAAKVEQLVAESPDPDLIVEFDNQLIVDTNTQQDPFMCVKVKLVDGEQIDLASSPTHRFRGNIELAVALPKNQGSSRALKILDYYYPKIHKNNFSGVRTYMATTAADTEHMGWMYYAVAIPFWYDSK